MLEVDDHDSRTAMEVVIGVDTHQEQHVAVAIDQRGVRLGRNTRQ